MNESRHQQLTELGKQAGGDKLVELVSQRQLSDLEIELVKRLVSETGHMVNRHCIDWLEYGIYGARLVDLISAAMAVYGATIVAVEEQARKGAGHGH